MTVKAEKWAAEPILIITESTRKSTKRKNQQKEEGEETKKTEALIVTAGGIIYGGYSNELIIQWHGNGVCLRDFALFCTYVSRIWVGYVSGMIQLIDLKGNLTTNWVGQNCPVIKW